MSEELIALMRRNLDRIAEAFERVAYERQEFVDLGHRVLVRVAIRARGSRSELDLETEVGQLWTIRGDGMATRLDVFGSWDGARDALGLGSR